MDISLNGPLSNPPQLPVTSATLCCPTIESISLSRLQFLGLSATFAPNL